MHWNGEISLGNVISLLVMMITLYTLHTKNVERIARIELRVETMWDSFKRKFHVDSED